MIYASGEKKKEISLKIKTLIIDEENPNLIAEELEGLLLKAMREELTEEEINDALGSDATDEIELCTEGFIETNERGQIEISYMENEEDPQLRTKSKIVFHSDEPSLVIMSKEGAISTVLSFEEGKTHICAYDTPFMPFKVYVTTKKLVNNLLESGKMKLDYILNINDTDPQHFIITITLKDAPEDILKGIVS
jgi:uncharacterized beta-barrel protein YwiB (DUF1934 family)